MKSSAKKRQASAPSSAARVAQPHRAALLRRLNRISGQVRGVAGMIEEERYCVDVLTQIAAIRSALDAVAMQLLEDHAHGCVHSAIRAGRGNEAVDEFMAVVKRFAQA
jgi:DNA-binding FrmR family transcriptional regulator